jgi:hypothetical protein
MESITGDIPSPSKKLMGGTTWDVVNERLSIDNLFHSSVWQIVKMADVLEAAIFLYEEMAMGNKSVARIYRSLWKGIEETWDKFDFDQMPPVPKPTAQQILTNITTSLDSDQHPPLDHL